MMDTFPLQSIDGAQPLLTVNNLSVSYGAGIDAIPVLHDVSFAVYPGETLAILGESGCGKSTLGRALMGLLPASGHVTHGDIYLTTVGQQNLVTLPNHKWQRLRGQEIGLVLQDPMQALNPLLTIEAQVVEALRVHRQIVMPQARSIARSMLHRVGLSQAERVLRSYPFQLSGGMCQRVAIAIALINGPRLLIADEPTTALDMRVQAMILELIGDLQRELGTAVVLISHDVGVLARLAHRVAVMYNGRIVEYGSAATVLHQPRHPYTHALLDCLPDNGRLPQPLQGQPPTMPIPTTYCSFCPRCRWASDVCRSILPELVPRTSGAKKPVIPHRVACHYPLESEMTDLVTDSVHPPESEAGRERSSQQVSDVGPMLLEVRDITKYFQPRGWLGRQPSVVALRNVTLTIASGETVGLVGESGCGKSTLARCILRLEKPTAGTISLRGQDLLSLRGEPLRKIRRTIQPVFQDARGSLNRGRMMLDIVREPLDYFRIGSARQRHERVREFLAFVGLGPELFDRRPHQLSTGQCQRIAIARALVLEPELLICDEPVSALDLSIQAQILQLLATLQARLGFGMLFISHNLLVVQALCQRVVVMRDGQVCEELPAQHLQRAQHPYTRALLEATPRLTQNRISNPGDKAYVYGL